MEREAETSIGGALPTGDAHGGSGVWRAPEDGRRERVSETQRKVHTWPSSNRMTVGPDAPAVAGAGRTERNARAEFGCY